MKIADATDKLTVRLLLDGPHAIAAKLPRSQKNRDMSPSVGPRECTAVADEPHHFGIGAHPEIRLQISARKCAKYKSVGLNSDHVGTFCLTSKMSHDPRWRAACASGSGVKERTRESRRRDSEGRWL